MKNLTPASFLGKLKLTIEELGPFDLAMEIGCFEGITSLYLADNKLKPGGKLICVDPLVDVSYQDSKFHKKFKGQHSRFKENTKNRSDIKLVRKSSRDAFPKLLKKYKGLLDFIYIDGDHRSYPVYLDGVNSFKLCKPGGYIVFDDYWWKGTYGFYITKRGIDRFLKEHEGRYSLLEKGWQILIQKNETDS